MKVEGFSSVLATVLIGVLLLASAASFTFLELGASSSPPSEPRQPGALENPPREFPQLDSAEELLFPDNSYPLENDGSIQGENQALVLTSQTAALGGAGGSDAEYLIITRPMFLDALQPLVDLKSQRMSVKVVTVEEIAGKAWIYPSDDAWVDEFRPDQNHGSEATLDIGPDYITASYLKFPLSSVPPGITILDAKLHLYCYYIGDWTNVYHGILHRVNDDNWSEDTITYNNVPAGGSREDWITVDEAGQWYSWDVTAWIQNEFGGDKVASVHIYGGQAASPDETGVKRFRSKEYEGTAYDPYLEITYSLERTYPGRDIPEQIRNYIRDHHENHGTKWVLLAGDVDPDDCIWENGRGYVNYALDKDWEVPVRYALDNSLPTDYYYAGLDGTWDDDGDNIFGEAGEVDWEADVYVGRIPARGASTMQVVVEKTVAYELNPPRKIKDVAFFGAREFGPICPGIKEKYIPDEVNVHEFYEWEGTLDYTSFETINDYNPTLVFAAGHGNEHGIYLSDSNEPFVDVNSPTALSNKGFLMFSWSCRTNAFDYSDNCLGEAMLYGPYLSDPPYGAAVGYVGFVRSPDFGDDIGRKLFEEIFWNQEYHQGAIFYKANERAADSRVDRLMCALLGDPELKIVEPVLVSISPGHGSGLPGEELTYTVTVRNMSNKEENYTLTAADNAGWNLGISPNTLTVPADENRTATLSVTVPSSAPIGAEDKITVTATSTENAEASDNASCMAHAGLRVVIYPSADIYANGRDYEMYFRTQLKFDISGIPSDAYIASTKLWLYRYLDWGLGSWDGGVTTNRVDDQTWDESIGADQFNSQLLTTQQEHEGKWISDGWDYVSVMNQLGVDRGANNTYTSLRLRWTGDAGTQPVTGCQDDTWLEIGSSYPNEPGISFYSSEYSDPAYHSYLEVIYVLRGVEVSISPSENGALPGENVSFTITVTNTGDVEDTYDLSVSDNAGWMLESVFYLTASDDAYVELYTPDSNYGASTTLYLDSSAYRNILVKFDLTDFADNAIIENATLNLFHYSYQSGLTTPVRTYGAYRVLADWDESTVTYNTRPTYSDVATSLITFDATETGYWRTWDVTTDLDNTAIITQNWASWYIPTSVGGWWLAFRSKEYSGTTYDPYLEIVTFSGAISPPSLTVPPGENRTATLTITIPENAEPNTEDNITVTATSQTDNTVENSASCIAYAVGVTPVRGVEVSISPENQTGLPGENLTYTVTVKNTGEAEDTYDLSASDTEGWLETCTTQIYPNDDAYVSAFWPGNNFNTGELVVGRELAAQRRTYLKFYLNIAGQVSSAKLYLYWKNYYLGNNIIVVARKVENDNWLENEITWNNKPPVVGDIDTRNFTSGGWIWWDVTSWVKNQRLTDNVVSIELYATQWQVEHKFWSKEYDGYDPYLEITTSAGISPSTLTVPSGENRTATLTITIPENAEPNTEDNITITAISQADPAVSGNASCIASVDDSVEIYPSDDAHVNEWNPGNNYNNDFLIIGYTKPRDVGDFGYRDTLGGYNRAWLKFDLSSIPNGATITCARLLLYFWHSGVDGGARWGIEAHFSENDDWQENTITWNNKPLINSPPIDNIPYFSTYAWPDENWPNGSWKMWAVTADVQQEFNGDKRVTLCLKATKEYMEESVFNVAFSKEFIDGAGELIITYPPRLEVFYVPP